MSSCRGDEVEVGRWREGRIWVVARVCVCRSWLRALPLQNFPLRQRPPAAIYNSALHPSRNGSRNFGNKREGRRGGAVQCEATPPRRQQLPLSFPAHTFILFCTQQSWTRSMATLAPIPTAKRQRLNAAAESKRVAALVDEGKLNPTTDNVIIQLQSSVDGETLGPSISLPAGNTGQRELQMIVNQLRRQSRAGKKRRVDDGSESQEEDYDDDDDEDLPFAFHLDVSTSEGTSTQPTRLDITTSISQDVLQAAFARKLDLSAEDTLRIVFEPQAVFKVRPVRRCSNTLSGE